MPAFLIFFSDNFMECRRGRDRLPYFIISLPFSELHWTRRNAKIAYQFFIYPKYSLPLLYRVGVLLFPSYNIANQNILELFISTESLACFPTSFRLGSTGLKQR